MPPGAPDVPGSRQVSPAAVEFTEELARHRPERTRPLPARYEPIARMIVGDRRVHLASGVASRRALARVGKRAATTDDVIHVGSVDPPPDVMAHELTHVAHPSPVPRFFDDDHRGPEERAADEVAEVIRRSPVLPRTSAASSNTIQRTVAPAIGPRRVSRGDEPTASHGSGADGTVDAASLAASIGTNTTANRTVRRRTAAAGFNGAASPVPAAPTAASRQRAPASGIGDVSGAHVASAPAASPDPAAGPQGAPTTSDILSQFDGILELLEERIITELERRGGRYRGGF